MQMSIFIGFDFVFLYNLNCWKKYNNFELDFILITPNSMHYFWPSSIRQKTPKNHNNIGEGCNNVGLPTTTFI